MLSTLVHLSDLHFGSGDHREMRARGLLDALMARDVGHVVVTGDVTQRGREEEYEAFLDMYAPLFRAGRITVIPGNHDRSGDDVADSIMEGERVCVRVRGGLYMVLVDSTGPHNRDLIRAHGMLTVDDLRAIDDALTEAPADRLVVVLMHHHPYPLPEEGALEMLSRFVGLPFAGELDAGADLLAVVRGRCDLLLHGHRHIPRVRVLDEVSARPLGIYNAGSSVDLLRGRVFVHEDGCLRTQPRWLEAVPAMATRRPRRDAGAPSLAVHSTR